MTDEVHLSIEPPSRGQIYEDVCQDIFDLLLEHSKMFQLFVPEMLGCLDTVKARIIQEAEALDAEGDDDDDDD